MSIGFDLAAATTSTKHEIGSFSVSHTMDPAAFKAYLATKVDAKSISILQVVAGSSGRLSVHGVRSEDIPALLGRLNLTETRRAQRNRRDRENRPHKIFNSIRPILIEAMNALGEYEAVVQCNPSSEYVAQTSEVFAAWSEIYMDKKIAVSRVHYSSLEVSLADHYCFDDMPKVEDASIFVMGDVDDLAGAIESTNGALISSPWKFFGTDERFGICSVGKPAQETLFYMVGVKESFWGSFAAQIAEKLARRRALHVIYIAKGGTLQHQASVFSVGHPTSYSIAREAASGPKRYIQAPIPYPPLSGIEDIPLLSFIGEYPRLRTHHVSVPTVVGQSKTCIRNLDGETIDIEVSHMADRIGQANQEAGLACRFTALQFLTDALNPFPNVSVIETSGLSNVNKEYYHEKEKFVWEALRVVTVMCQVSLEEKIASRLAWGWSAKSTHDLLSDWGSVFGELKHSIKRCYRLPTVAIEQVLLRCRYATFYSDDASIVELFKEASMLKSIVPFAYHVLDIMANYYNPGRERIAGSVDAERTLLRDLMKLIEQPVDRSPPLPKFVAMAFYTQMASHTVEAELEDYREQAIRYADQALSALDYIYQNDRDRQFERVHLLRNRARLARGAESIEWYDKAISEWTDYVGFIAARADDRFVSACRVHLLMCQLERKNLLNQDGQSLVNDIGNIMKTFARSHPLSYWVGLRAIAKPFSS